MSDRKEYLLSALRVGSIRAKLFETEINSIGVALKAELINAEDAVAWITEIGAAGLVALKPEGQS
jgi:hypothetical protein